MGDTMISSSQTNKHTHSLISQLALNLRKFCASSSVVNNQRHNHEMSKNNKKFCTREKEHRENLAGVLKVVISCTRIRATHSYTCSFARNTFNIQHRDNHVVLARMNIIHFVLIR